MFQRLLTIKTCKNVVSNHQLLGGGKRDAWFWEVEKVIWNIIISSLPQHLVEELKCPTTQTRKGKWLGIFPNEEHPNPYGIFATT